MALNQKRQFGLGIGQLFFQSARFRSMCRGSLQSCAAVFLNDLWQEKYIV